MKVSLVATVRRVALQSLSFVLQKEKKHMTGIVRSQQISTEKNAPGMEQQPSWCEDVPELTAQQEL